MNKQARRTVALVAVLAMVAGCNSAATDEGNSKPVDDSSSAAAATTDRDQQFVRGQIPEEDEARASQLVAGLKAQLQQDLAALRERVEVAAEADKARLYAELNPVPDFVSDMLKLVQTFPEAPSTFDGALAGLGYADSRQRDVLMNYLLDQWPARLNYRKIVDYLLQQVPAPQIEEWFDKVIAAAPHGVVQAEAMMGFKTYFDQKPVFAKTLRFNPDIAEQIPQEQRAYIDAPLNAVRKAKLADYLQAVIDKYGDLEYSGSGFGSTDTFGQMARQELFELNHLNVGDVAPDIVGQDLDGATFRLSDYRGKVVMLDFWGQWCPPCRRMYPYERELVRQLTGLPFALIGVNSDRELETARASVRDEKLPWRNFWSGPQGTSGPIARQWNISEWPTVYLIDGDGVIRYKQVLGNDIERGIETLLAELGHIVDLAPVEVAAR
jgi:thiol-disulfide isomerase/thioredoxin